MCYAIPGKLIEVNGNIATIDYFGEKKKALLDYDDVKAGDYVYAQGGVLIDKISEDKALEILTAWEEIFFELKKTDEAQATVRGATLSKETFEIIQKANQHKELTKGQLLTLMRLGDKDGLQLLYESANNMRQKNNGNACCVHGIIEFSNYCQNDCLYCGIRKSRTIARYRMDSKEILGLARRAAGDLRFKALVLQSGEDLSYDDEMLYDLVKEIRRLGVLIFLSIGERDKRTYERLFEAGARATLLRFETSNKDIFRKVKPDTTFEERIKLIKHLKSIGYVVATGFLIGLPEERDEDIIDNILLTKSLGADMYSFGPFLPTKDTPLEKHRARGSEAVLKIIAITRLIDREAKILVTTAMEMLDPRLKKEALLAGANSLMINITPKDYRPLYRIYDNRAGEARDVKYMIDENLQLLYSLGRAPTDLGA